MKLFKFLAIALIACFFATSCDTGGGLSDLRNRIDALEKSNIPTMGEQMIAMSNSMESLLKTQSSLLEYIKNLQAEVNDLEKGITPDMKGIQDQINTLKGQYDSYSASLENLQKLIDSKNSETKDWVKTTYATLEQYEKTQTELSTIKALISSVENIDQTISKAVNAAIAESEKSIKSWVGEQLKGYYTIAEIDAKLSNISTGGSAAVDETARQSIETVKGSINTAKEELTTAYKAAIAEAITKNNGVIEGTIAEKVKEANQTLDKSISEINTKIKAIEDRLDKVEAQIKDLLSRIQSISVIPEYSDGSVGVKAGSKNIRFEIYPLEAAEKLSTLGTSVLSLKAVYTKTKAAEAGDFATIGITAVSYANNVFTVTTDASALDEAFFEGKLPASARLLATVGGAAAISPYFTLTPEK